MAKSLLDIFEDEEVIERKPTKAKSLLDIFEPEDAEPEVLEFLGPVVEEPKRPETVTEIIAQAQKAKEKPMSPEISLPPVDVPAPEPIIDVKPEVLEFVGPVTEERPEEARNIIDELEKEPDIIPDTKKPSILKEFGKGLARGTINTAQGLGYVRVFIADLLGEEKASNIWREALTQTEEFKQEKLRSDIEFEGVKSFANPYFVVGMVAEQMPLMASAYGSGVAGTKAAMSLGKTLGLKLPARTLARIGAVAGSSVGVGSLEAGMFYEEARSEVEKGNISIQKAMAITPIVGIVNGFIENAPGLGVVQRIIKGPGGKKLLFHIFSNAIREGTEETIQGSVSDFMSKIGWDKDRKVFTNPQRLIDFLGGAITSAPFSAFGAVQQNIEEVSALKEEKKEVAPRAKEVRPVRKEGEKVEPEAEPVGRVPSKPKEVTPKKKEVTEKPKRCIQCVATAQKKAKELGLKTQVGVVVDKASAGKIEVAAKTYKLKQKTDVLGKSTHMWNVDEKGQILDFHVNEETGKVNKNRYFTEEQIKEHIEKPVVKEKPEPKYKQPILRQIKSEIDAGELISGSLIKDEQGKVIDRVPFTSTFPKYFQKKGYTKKSALTAIDKHNAGKELTKIQADMLEDLYFSSGLESALKYAQDEMLTAMKNVSQEMFDSLTDKDINQWIDEEGLEGTITVKEVRDEVNNTRAEVKKPSVSKKEPEVKKREEPVKEKVKPEEKPEVKEAEVVTDIKKDVPGLKDVEIDNNRITITSKDGSSISFVKQSNGKIGFDVSSNDLLEKYVKDFGSGFQLSDSAIKRFVSDKFGADKSLVFKRINEIYKQAGTKKVKSEVKEAEVKKIEEPVKQEVKPISFVDKENLIEKYKGVNIRKDNTIKKGRYYAVLPEHRGVEYGSTIEILKRKLDRALKEKPKVSAVQKLVPSQEVQELASRIWQSEMPLEERTPERINKTKLITTAEKLFKVPIRGKVTHRMGKAAGWYQRKGALIRLKKWGELEPLTHEIAHHLDRQIGKKEGIQWKLKTFKGQDRKDVSRELKKLDYDQGQKRISEGFAEFMRHYITDTGQAKKLAPKFYDYFINNYLVENKKDGANIEAMRQMYDVWKKQGSEARMIQQMDFHGEHTKVAAIAKDRAEKARNWIKSKWFDELATIQEVVRKVEKITKKKLTPTQDPFQMATYYKAKAGSIARTFVKDKAIDPYGKVIGKGLIEIIKPVKKDIKDFIVYAVAKRAALLQDRGKESGFDVDDIKYVIDKFKNKEWDNVIDEITEWNNNVLSHLVEAGGISSEAVKLIREINPIYLPFKRAFIDEMVQVFPNLSRGFVDQGQAVKTLKGSSRPIINPIEAMISQATEMIAKAQKIHVARLFAELAEEKEIGGFITKVPAQLVPQKITKEWIMDQLEKAGVVSAFNKELDLSNMDEVLTVFTQSNQYRGKENIVSIWRNGKQEFYEVNPELYQALKGLDFVHRGPVLKILGPFARMLRLGATGIKLSFPFRNLFRDSLSYAVNSKHKWSSPVEPLLGIVKDLKAKEGDLAWRFTRAGGQMTGMFGYDRASTMFIYDEHFKTILEQLKEKKVLQVVAKPLGAFRELLNVGEMGPRISELEKSYKQAIKDHPEWSEYDAFVKAFNDAQDVTINFTRSGSYGKITNEAIAFTNAALQGVDKIRRNFQERPIETIVKGIAYLTLYALYNWYKNKDKAWYKNMPPAYKYSNFFFEIDDKIIRMPAPYDIGTIFYSAPSAFLDFTYTKDPESLKGLIDIIEKQIPELIPSAVKPLYDVARNKNFLNVPIVTKGMEYKYPTERYSDYTSQIAKSMSKGLDQLNIKIAPVQIDYLMHNYTGGFLRQIPRKNMVEVEEWPVVGDFLVRAPLNPRKQLNVFFKDYEVLSQKRNSKIASKKELSEFVRIKPLHKRLMKSFKRLKVARRNKNVQLRDNIYKEMTKQLNRFGYK